MRKKYLQLFIVLVTAVLLFADVSAYEPKIDFIDNRIEIRKSQNTIEPVISGSMPGGSTKIIPIGVVSSRIVGQPETGVILTAYFRGDYIAGQQFSLTVSANGRKKTAIGKQKIINGKKMVVASISISDNKPLFNATVSWTYGHIF